MSSRDLFLAIDVGTGSVRSALVDINGNLVAFQAKEHDQLIATRDVLPAQEDGVPPICNKRSCSATWSEMGSCVASAVGPYNPSP